MNNYSTQLGREFKGKHYPKIKGALTTPRKKIRSKLRGFLPLNVEVLFETLPKYQPISRRNSGLNPGI